MLLIINLLDIKMYTISTYPYVRICTNIDDQFDLILLIFYVSSGTALNRSYISV